jgi:hypothetical protein
MFNRLTEPVEEPHFIYSYREYSSALYSTDLHTGKTYHYRIPSYQFKRACSWCELPQGYLWLIGGFPPTDEVKTIDTTREFAVCDRTPLLTARCSQTAVYHAPYLYVLGGYNQHVLDEVERYAEGAWEALPPLPTACSRLSSIVAEECLYVLGGYSDTALDLIQRLSLTSLTWTVLDVRLPAAAYYLACFTQKTPQIYFVRLRELYCFELETSHITRVKAVTRQVFSYFGPNYFYNGTLYCANSDNAVEALAVGSLLQLTS